MADRTLTPVHPLADRWARLAAVEDGTAGALRLELEAPVAAVDLRVDPRGTGPDAVAAAVGGPLPSAPDTWTAHPTGIAVRLGPDEWLLTSTTADPEEWEFHVDETAAAHGGMAVDVSAQRTSVRVLGAAARDLLAFGCALDLRPAAFPRGRCAQTLLGQAAVLLVAHAVDDLQIVVRSSFAGYVADWLVDAAADSRS
ncbi:sarcosine oxidase subunit gamma family protein [Actinomycetospora lutea]|uniref:sarcosine oxidase subunit gamma n=1 Tax=Actinomycetospora lutea TaxID=663604 RepID=UPI00236688A6|nr:sarcosine oxidase subunit gamma family protein [Actinomycetospora lutea]MDD7941236.1 sarcosine oxidase subunit gamma family protein [Actinomycetospora lutea]